MKAQPSTLLAVDTMPEKWFIVDAKGLILGRVAARVAKLLRGKTEATYCPHQNPKVHVVVINADKVVLTSDKLTEKTYYWHSKYRTGLKTTTPAKLLETRPAEVLRRAIHGMLPKNRLGSILNKNCRVYAGAEHPHQAQQPQPLVLKTRAPRVAA